MKLTAKQQIRIDIISKYLGGGIYYQDACDALEIKERQFRRLVRAFKKTGILSILHGNIGRKPKNKLSEGARRVILAHYRGRYNGLNLVHFIEKLVEEEVEVIPSYSTVRNLLMSEKLVSVQIKRPKKSHPMRKRYEKEGLMVQIDGSPHRWIANKLPCCLTLAMDDATGKILSGKFTKTETTFAAMDVVEDIIKKNGIFQILYSDRAGIYGGGKRDGFSNMNRAMKELGILSIQANSPQAKGRVERAFRTLQGRLVDEMRLRGISSLEQANFYFKNEFIEEFNKKFGVTPVSSENAYKPVPEKIDLNEVFCMKEDRLVQPGEVISYQSDKYLLKHGSEFSLQKKTVETRMYRNGDFRIFFQNKEVLFELIEYQKRVA